MPMGSITRPHDAVKNTVSRLIHKPNPTPNTDSERIHFFMEKIAVEAVQVSVEPKPLISSVLVSVPVRTEPTSTLHTTALLY